MIDAQQLLSQDLIAGELIAQLSRPQARVWLEGSSGTGKSNIARLIIEGVSAFGSHLGLSGDAARTATPYLAIHRALAGKRLRKALRDAKSNSVVAPLKAIPVIGGAVSDFAKMAVAGLGQAVPEFLTADQQDLLQGLQGIAGQKHLVIVVDDVQWIDADSANLLSLLSMPEVLQAYPFARLASLLLIENVDARRGQEPRWLSQLRTSDSLRVGRPTRDRFPDVLRAFGLSRELPETLLDALYAVSGGHLEIAKQIVQIDEGVDLASLVRDGDAASLMGRLLALRIGEAAQSDPLMRLLRIGACAGSAFTKAELQCAFTDNEGFAAALAVACQEQLLAAHGDVLSFSHEVIRGAAEHVTAEDARSVHAKLAECLRLLRPGDYGSRLRHVRMAEDFAHADELAFVVAMEAVRGERLPLETWTVGRFTTTLEDARTSYRLMDEGDHRGAISTMMRHYDGTQTLAQGEIVAIIALNQLKLCTDDGYNEAAGLLEHWLRQRLEPEIWQRLMSILMSAWVLCGQTDQATSLYATMAHDLALQATKDVSARSRLEALNRKADMVFTSEISVKHIQSAATWFGPAHDADIPRNAFEYTASLVNLSGALYTLGCFTEGANAAAEALQWSDRLRSSGSRAVEPYKALNNLVICSFRAGGESADQAGKALELLLSHERRPLHRDRSLMAINRATLALLAGDLPGGRDLLERVWTQISTDDLESYYLMYCGSNLAVALSLTGERDGAQKLMASVAPHIETVPKWFRSAHRRRHALMLQAMANPDVATPEAMDAYPLNHRQPDGPQDSWWSIGRGLLMSDIQSWSEG